MRASVLELLWRNGEPSSFNCGSNYEPDLRGGKKGPPHTVDEILSLNKFLSYLVNQAWV
jgi:hypothetical protein